MAEGKLSIKKQSEIIMKASFATADAMSISQDESAAGDEGREWALISKALGDSSLSGISLIGFASS
jgi:hypothetical protein